MTGPSGEQAFLARYPEYQQTALLDELRRTGYSRLDATHHAYLDYTGGGLYTEAQVAEHLELLRQNIFGNPHSANPTSLAMTDLVESTRRTILAWFNAAADYRVVFTANASGALKLIGESFPFEPASRFLLTFDNHNSVNGIREFATARGASVVYSPLTYPDLRIDSDVLEAHLKARPETGESLFAFPAQSNYSGVKHPLDWVARAQSHGWRVLLDAAAFVPANRLDLSAVKPDFVSVSFYKMFGYPTGVGALLIHKRAISTLRRPWFSGGTVNFTTVQNCAHLLSSGEAGFEDGTVNYLAIPAVGIGLAHLSRIGIDTIQTRIRCLTGHLLEQLQQLKHSSGRALVKLHGPGDTESRGGTITFNLYDPTGARVDYRRIEELAGEAGISIRTGCFCNPGANEAAEQLSVAQLDAGLALGDELNLPNFVRLMDSMGADKSAGAIRVSLGLATNYQDIEKCIGFFARFLNQSRATIGQVTIEDDSCRVIRESS